MSKIESIYQKAESGYQVLKNESFGNSFLKSNSNNNYDFEEVAATTCRPFIGDNTVRNQDANTSSHLMLQDRKQEQFTFGGSPDPSLIEELRLNKRENKISVNEKPSIQALNPENEIILKLEKNKHQSLISPHSIPRKMLDQNKKFSDNSSTIAIISDKNRGGQKGKLLLMPTLKSFIQCKKEETKTEKFKQKFQQQMENINQEILQKKKSSLPKDNVEQIQNINQNLSSNKAQRPQRNTLCVDTGDRNISKDEIISPIKLGNHQVHVFKTSQRVSTLVKNNEEFLNKFKGMQEQKEVEKKKKEENFQKKINWIQNSMRVSNSDKDKESIIETLRQKQKLLTPRRGAIKDIKLDPSQVEEQSLYKNFGINKHERSGTVFVYSTKLVTDDDLFQFLLTQTEENITKFSVSNGQITDSGIVILCEYFLQKNCLQKLKLYNNIMFSLLNWFDVPYLMQGTQALAKCIANNTKLQTLELHGFFLYPNFFSEIIDSLLLCPNLKILSFSNNNIQDGGILEINRLVEAQNSTISIPLETLTIYNNNITDEGAKSLAIALECHLTLRILNLQMNFIKDPGGQAFLDALDNDQYPDIWKIILLDNQCSEGFKRKAKKYDLVIL